MINLYAAFQREFVQTNALDGCPDNRQTTNLRREQINLIGALAYITEQALNGIGALNVSAHRGRERIKRQEVLFVLSQASHRLGDSAYHTWF